MMATSAVRFGAWWLVTSLAIATALTACGGDNDLSGFEIQLSFAGASGGQRACSQVCNEYPLVCPSKLSVRVADADDPEVEHFFRCVNLVIEPGDSLCAMAQIDVDIDGLPAGPSRLEVALWRTDLLEDEQCLRGSLFDLRGEPLITVSPQPAVAGSTYLDVGRQAQAVIPMACTAPEQVDGSQCRDLGDETGVTGSAAQNLSLQAGWPLGRLGSNR
ncbi:MAG: hypothetical protein AAGC55_12335 [Myxococcota bacterium]